MNSIRQTMNWWLGWSGSKTRKLAKQKLS